MKNKTMFRIYLIYFVAMLSVAVVFLLADCFKVFRNDYLSTFLIQIVTMFAIPLLMYSLMISKNVKTTFKDFGFRRISGNMVLLSFALGVTLFVINKYVATFASSIISLFGYETLPTASGTTQFSYGLLLKEFILSAVFPGFFEEFLHRGMMLHASKKAGNPKVALFVSSILFGLVHMNINQFFYAMILGILMGIVALTSDSIFPTMIIHFTNNVLSTYFYYGYYLKWPIASAFYAIEEIFMSSIFLYIFASTAVIILMVGLYIFLLKRMKTEKRKYDKSQPQPALVARMIEKKSSTANYLPKVCTKTNFVDRVFLYSSVTLGVLMTVMSFVSGVI